METLDKFPKGKILIIDDEKMLLELFRRILTTYGFAVDVAESAKQGIKKIHTIKYNLIFTDIKMPGMSGHELFDYVKKNVDQAIPIIAMSGTPWLLKNSNFDAVIAKPFCKEEMLDMVHQFIQEPEPQ